MEFADPGASAYQLKKYFKGVLEKGECSYSMLCNFPQAQSFISGPSSSLRKSIAYYKPLTKFQIHGHFKSFGSSLSQQYSPI